MKSLVLTLGHNSSAALVQDGHVLAAYEEERLSEIKSDSAFPYKAIKAIVYRYGSHFDNCFVGHWFNAGNLTECKYYDEDFILNYLSCQKGQLLIGLPQQLPVLHPLDHLLSQEQHSHF